MLSRSSTYFSFITCRTTTAQGKWWKLSQQKWQTSDECPGQVDDIDQTMAHCLLDRREEAIRRDWRNYTFHFETNKKVFNEMGRSVAVVVDKHFLRLDYDCWRLHYRRETTTRCSNRHVWGVSCLSEQVDELLKLQLVVHQKTKESFFINIDDDDERVGERWNCWLLFSTTLYWNWISCKAVGWGESNFTCVQMPR